MPKIDWGYCALEDPIFKYGYDAMVSACYPPITSNGVRILLRPDRCEATINHIRNYGVVLSDGTHATLRDLGDNDMIIGEEFWEAADRAIHRHLYGRTTDLPRKLRWEEEGYVDILDATVFGVTKGGPGHMIREPRHVIEKRLRKKKMGKRGPASRQWGHRGANEALKRQQRLRRGRQ